MANTERRVMIVTTQRAGKNEALTQALAEAALDGAVILQPEPVDLARIIEDSASGSPELIWPDSDLVELAKNEVRMLQEQLGFRVSRRLPHVEPETLRPALPYPKGTTMYQHRNRPINDHPRRLKK